MEVVSGINSKASHFDGLEIRRNLHGAFSISSHIKNLSEATTNLTPF